jgi:antitoxin (DNA-binding transcriptional repressor) of toxin-antitoxin stability system
MSESEEIIIAKAGKPVARLAPIEAKATKKRVPGIDKGKIWMASDSMSCRSVHSTNGIGWTTSSNQSRVVTILVDVVKMGGDPGGERKHHYAY